MIGYTYLARFSTFTALDVEKLTNNKKTAYSLLERLMKKGLVIKIRRNIYSCINPATGEVMATKYQIACATDSSAYLSHHTALEYYGLTNQVYNMVYVSSESRSRGFEFDSKRYEFLPSLVREGVVDAKNTQGVRITDIERTVVDSIKDFEIIGGLEELLNCLEAITYLSEDRLINYLDLYGVQALYQKAGYLLAQYKHKMQLSEDFINYCRSKVGKSTRYLLKDNNTDVFYNGDWQLVVPFYIFKLVLKGENYIV